MYSVPTPCSNERLGSFTRLEVVPLAWVESYGVANDALQWLGGITLLPGRDWLPISGTFNRRSFTNAVNGRLWNRQVGVQIGQDDETIQRILTFYARHRFAVRIVANSYGWLLASPKYPATFSHSTDYGTNPSEKVKQSIAFATVTAQPVYRWDFIPAPNYNPNGRNFSDDFTNDFN